MARPPGAAVDISGPAATVSLKPGQTLSHYRIDRQIGEGGMGAVFLAEDTKLGRPVALKVLPPEMASNPDRLGRFQREARSVAALNHPNIVTLHSVEEEGGIHFLTMELVEGESLDRQIPPGGLPLARVFDVGIALADALAAAHEKGIIHRDLKPANVMVTKDGRIKILDFGLAKLAVETAGDGPPPKPEGEATSAPTEMAGRDEDLTAAGVVMGTVPYMSPEQVGGEAVDARTDIFSLGVLLYELATGRRPFAGKNRAELISSIVRDTPRPLAEARQDAPRHLGRIIGHCLQKDPEARYQSAKDVRNELKALRKEIDSGASGVTGERSAAVPAGMTGGAPSGAPPPGFGTSSGPASEMVSGAGPSAASSGPVSGSGIASSGISSVLPSQAERKPWITGAVVGAAVVILIIGAFWLGGRGGPGEEAAKAAGESAAASGAASTSVLPAAEAEKGSLAVLPFQNMSRDEDQEYFADGLSEELMSALAKVNGLRVAGRTSSFSFKGKQEELGVIAEKLGVAHILEGSVRKSGNAIRVTAQLVNASDGFQLWSETYDRTLDDIFAVQDDIATSVASALELTLLGRSGGSPTVNTEAYDLVLRARYVLAARTGESIEKGREILERALAFAPDYAPAWAEMGLVHGLEAERATTVEESTRARDKSLQALQKALDRDPDNPEALSRMSLALADLWRFDDALRFAERALEVAPDNPVTLGNAALLYTNLGRFDEARLLEERSVRIDPLDTRGLANLAGSYVYADRLEDAERTLERVLELNPGFPVVRFTQGMIHLKRGRAEAARRSFKEFEEALEMGDYIALFLSAVVEHSAGNEEASASAADEFESRFCPEDPGSCAQIRAWRGETDAAFTWLEKALSLRDPWLAGIKKDSWMESLHSDPRWNDLLTKIGLPVD